jgi:hypothetical protein
MEWVPQSSEFAEKEEAYAKAASVAALLTSGVMPEADAMVWNDRHVAALRRLHDCANCIDEDGGDDLTDRLIAQVNVAADDIVGDGLDGHQDPDIYTLSDEARAVMALSTAEKRSVITPEVLARRWRIGLSAAKRTLSVTTQAGIRNVLVPAERRTRQKLNHLKFPTLKASIYSDTMFASKLTSLRGCNAAQVFTNGKGYDRFYPIKTKKLASEGLMTFIQEAGIPKLLITDNAPEEVAGEWGHICRKFHVQQKQIVPHSPWSNLAEASIRELKKSIRRILRTTGAP